MSKGTQQSRIQNNMDIGQPSRCLHLESSALPNDSESSETPLRRFSHWLCSGWTPMETASGAGNDENNGTSLSPETAACISEHSSICGIGTLDEGIHHATSEAYHPEREDFSCRTCRIRKVECDRALPQCSHCLHEQLLCFYVEPLRISKKRDKDLQLQASLQEQRQTQLQESRC